MRIAVLAILIFLLHTCAMSNSYELILTSNLDQLPVLEEFIMTVCDELSVHEDVMPDIMLAVTEAISNAIIHGNEFDPSKSVFLHVLFSEPVVSFTIRDEGKGFEPSKLPSPVDDGNLLKSGDRKSVV